MNRFIAVVAIALSLSANAQECIKADYQELKDFNDKELISKYCADKQAFKLNSDVVEFKKSMYELASTINDKAGEKKHFDEWTAADQLARGCKSELDRVLRLLGQRNVNEAGADAQCAVNSKVKIPATEPLDIKSING